MRILHLGDLHLGRSLGEYDLIEDQRYILDLMISEAKDRSVDAVIIAGDVYDRAVPSEAATMLLDSFMTALSDAGITVFMISGNHDSDDRLNFGSTLFTSRNIFISSVFDGTLKNHTMSLDGTDVVFHMLPFIKASQVRHFYPDASIETYEDAVRTVIDNANIDTSKINVLIAHQFVAGGEDPRLAGSEGAGTQTVGLVEKIGTHTFDAFDYVALGHIHSPQQVGRETVRYAGSPLKYSLSESSNVKSMPLITIGSKEDIAVELIPLTPKRDLRHIKGKLAELLSPSAVESANDFIYATLTDEDIITDVMAAFRQTYPNTVKIDYDNSHTRELERCAISNITTKRSYNELIEDFYREVYGCDITDEEMDLMRTLAYETGIINEAG